jgi:hypothetical protein
MENKKKELLKMADRLSVIAKELDEQLEAKQPFKDRDVVEHIRHPKLIIKITDSKNKCGYGLNKDGIWEIRKDWYFNDSQTSWKLSTPEKWLEVCTKEAVNMGLVKKCTINFGKFNHILTDDNYYISEEGLFCDGMGWVLMRDGIWAEVIKDKTLEELFDNLAFNCEVVRMIKANPEAYIKAIKNLKK